MLSIIQVIIGILLVVVILLQQRGASVGGVFGGGGEVYGVKRGAEKVLLYVTIGLAAVFMLLGIAQLFV